MYLQFCISNSFVYITNVPITLMCISVCIFNVCPIYFRFRVFHRDVYFYKYYAEEI